MNLFSENRTKPVMVVFEFIKESECFSLLIWYHFRLFAFLLFFEGCRLASTVISFKCRKELNCTKKCIRKIEETSMSKRHCYFKINRYSGSCMNAIWIQTKWKIRPRFPLATRWLYVLIYPKINAFFVLFISFTLL